MSVQQERYYTYIELRRMAKERGVKLRFNISRSDLCELLNVSLRDRSVRYRGRLSRRVIRLLNIKTSDNMIFPSVTRVLSVLGISGGGSDIKRKIRKQKVVNISEDIHHHHGSTHTIVPHGSYTLHYVDED